MKKRSIIGLVGAVVFGATPAQATPASPPFSQSGGHASEPANALAPKPIRSAEQKRKARKAARIAAQHSDAVFRQHGMTKEQWCAVTEAVLEEEAQSSQRGRGVQRVSRKDQRRIQRLVDRRRHPEAFAA